MTETEGELLEALTRIHEVGGNLGTAFTLRQVGAVGCVLEEQLAVLTAIRIAAEAKTREEAARIADEPCKNCGFLPEKGGPE